jgi:lysyl endopeptidase
VSGGAELLYAEQTTDTSFLRLRDMPPPGVVFSGWSSALPALGTGITGLHHPQGGLQQIAFGAESEYLNCEDVAYCGDGADPEELHYLRVHWSSGATSAGSSGSGLFLKTGQLVGVLSGGFSRCDSPGGDDDYGRFDLVYRQALHRWLGPPGAASESRPDAGSRPR